MTISQVHENMIITIVQPFLDAMRLQITRNPLLDDDGTWVLSTNKSTWYQPQHGKDEYTPDMRVSHRDSTLFALEAAASQGMYVLKLKVERILADEDVLGVLVIKVAEASGRSQPSWAAPQDYFISSAAWAERMRTVDPYSGISADGLEWAKKTSCDLFFFPRGWCFEDGDPPAVSFRYLSFDSVSYSVAVPLERGPYRHKRLLDRPLVIHRARRREASWDSSRASAAHH